MSRIRDYSVALIAILLLGSGTGYGRETTCLDPPLPSTKAELLSPHKAVFSGKVVKIMLAHVHDVITFEVTQSWKGMDTHTAEMWRGVVAYKGVTFEVGETYLVFATGEDGDHQIFRIDSCSRSKKLAEAGREMALLGD
ncbi:MAG TPA: hypothetical protein VGK03_13910 [Geothrix sp.]|jgi:hypothetical protein